MAMTGWFDLIPVLGNLLDRVIPDPAQAAEAKLNVMKLAQEGELAKLNSETQIATNQAEINKIEAASDSLFKSGWRPGSGWVCVAGLAYQVLFRPVIGWIATNSWGWSAPPSLEMETLMTLLFGLLGLGAYRTVERVKASK